jgi:hypothetical protein
MAEGIKTGGRQAGTPNKTTTEARKAIALFVDQTLIGSLVGLIKLRMVIQ